MLININLLEIIFYAIGLIIVLYAIIAFILSRLFVPLLGFSETSIQKRLPDGMPEKIIELESKSRNKKEYLENVWKFMTSRYHGKSREYLRHPSTLWWSLRQAWKRTGFLPCTMTSYMTRILLVRSRFFTKKEVKTITYFHKFGLHQCIRVNLDDKWVYLDPWAQHIGYSIGKRLGFF